METFELSTFTKKTSELLHDAQETFERYDLPTDALPVARTDRAAYSLYTALTAGDKAKEAEEKIRAARDDVQHQFQESAMQVYGDLMQAMETRLTETIDPVIEELENNVQAFEDRKAQMAAYTEELQALAGQTQELLHEIQASAGMKTA